MTRDENYPQPGDEQRMMSQTPIDPYSEMYYQLEGLAISDEKLSGYPQPQLYDQHYINKYAYPKGLKTNGRQSSVNQSKKKSLYDMRAPNNRKGFSGWKLTKRPQEMASDFSLPMLVGNPSENLMVVPTKPSRMKPKRSKLSNLAL